MNKNKISYVIEEKLKEWIKTLPVDLQTPVKDSVFVSGGCIASMLLNEDVNDFDLYFTDSNVLTNLIEHYVSLANLYSNKNKKIHIEVVNEFSRVRTIIKSSGVASGDKEDLDNYDYFELEEGNPTNTNEFIHKIVNKDRYNNKYLPLLFTDNAVTLSGDIQVITRFVGDPEEIHKNFDFIHATNTYSFKDGLVLRPPAIESLLMKELRYNGSLYPVAALFRMRKFIQRGWKINAGQIFKIAFDVHKLNLETHSVLQDQLMGVDVAYFTEVLNKLKTTEDIDRTYLFKLLNEIFEGNEE